MEENKELFGDDSFEQDNGEATSEEAVTPEEDAKAAEGQEIADVPCAEGAPVEDQEPPAKKEKKQRVRKEHGGIGTFIVVFGVVLGVCLALLVGALFLGEGGFQIKRTEYVERTVYVREDEITGESKLTASEAADKIKKSTVSISVRTEGGTGIGSGFVYDANGHIATNQHVIEDAVSIQVITDDGRVLDASVVGKDEISDLAILKVEKEGLVPATLGKSGSLLVGESVVAVGTPASLDLAGTATFGKISDPNRLLPLRDSSGSVYRKIRVIQTDTSLNPGNSGAPLADMNGDVVGVVVRKISNYAGTIYEGVSFAIPIDGAKVILDAIVRDGAFTGDNPVAEGPSQLGVMGYSVEKDVWYYEDESGKFTASDTQKEGYHKAGADGVYVSVVSGAQASGKLLKGDIILSVNGLYVYTIYDVINEVNRHYAGESVTLTVLRGNDTENVEIVLGEGNVS